MLVKPPLVMGSNDVFSQQTRANPTGVQQGFTMRAHRRLRTKDAAYRVCFAFTALRAFPAFVLTAQLNLVFGRCPCTERRLQMRDSPPVRDERRCGIIDHGVCKGAAHPHATNSAVGRDDAGSRPGSPPARDEQSLSRVRRRGARRRGVRRLPSSPPPELAAAKRAAAELVWCSRSPPGHGEQGLSQAHELRLVERLTAPRGIDFCRTEQSGHVVGGHAPRAPLG